MHRNGHPLSRRQLLRCGVAASAVLALRSRGWSNDAGRANPEVCAFIKFVQGFRFDELAARIADAGFDGVEATVRAGGYIEPKDVEAQLPKLAASLAKHGLRITILCSDVVDVDQSHASSVLRTASELGIDKYRLGYYAYDLNRPILEQLDEIKRKLVRLADLNRELRLQALLQNHNGSNFVGAPIWDFHRLIEDLPVAQMAMAFDICHASIEGGRSWPVQYKLMRSHLGAVYVKDFDWNGGKVRQVPLGKGRIDRDFFRMLRDDGFAGPYSLHVEYLDDRSADENMQALAADLETLRGWLSR